jgi:hypothetical protein
VEVMAEWCKANPHEGMRSMEIFRASLGKIRFGNLKGAGASD